MTHQDRPLKKILFDWKQPKITNWKKCLRIKLLHNFQDVNTRGLSAQEVAIELLNKHRKDMDKEEIQFLESLFK